MKIGWSQHLELWARLVVWLGAVILLTSTIWEIIRSSNSIVSITYWIFPIATYITGGLDMYRFYKKMIYVDSIQKIKSRKSIN